MPFLSRITRSKHPVLILLAYNFLFLFVIVFLYQQSDRELQRQVKAKEIIAQTTILSKYFYDAGLAIGVYSLTKNQNFAERYLKLVEHIPGALEALHKLTNDQPTTQKSFLSIKQITEHGLTKLSEAKTTIDSAEFSSLTENQGQARNAYKEIKAIADQLQDKLDQLSQEQEKLCKDSPGCRLVFQLLLALSLIFYASCNLMFQQRVLKTL